MMDRIFTCWFLPAVALAAILFQLSGTDVQHVLRYERNAILGGELWRVISAHVVHLGWPHALWNVAALIIIFMLFGRAMSDRRWGYVTLVCAVGVAICLIAFNPEVSTYVGLSGILHGLFAAGALAERQAHRNTSFIMLVLLGAKLIWEQLAGPMPGTEPAVGGIVLVDAHLYGALFGLIAIATLNMLPSNKSEAGLEKIGRPHSD